MSNHTKELPQLARLHSLLIDYRNRIYTEAWNECAEHQGSAIDIPNDEGVPKKTIDEIRQLIYEEFDTTLRKDPSKSVVSIGGELFNIADIKRITSLHNDPTGRAPRGGVFTIILNDDAEILIRHPNPDVSGVRINELRTKLEKAFMEFHNFEYILTDHDD